LQVNKRKIGIPPVKTKHRQEDGKMERRHLDGKIAKAI
jgi:hypothetical protein